MDLFDVVKTGVRRWYVLVPLLVATVLAVTIVYRGVRTEYSTSMSVGIAAPSVVAQADPQATGVTRTNALLTSGGTTLIANLLSIGLQQPDVAARVVASGGTTNYSATVLTGSSSNQLPIVSIVATGPSSRSVEQTVSTLGTQATAVLASIQAGAGVPQDLNARLYPVQAPIAPVADQPGRLRSSAAIGVAGLLLALVLTALFDAVIRHRRAVGASHRSVVAVAG